MPMSQNNVFCILTADDNHEHKYPLWTYIMRHVLVSKDFWNILQGIDIRPRSVYSRSIEDIASPNTSSAIALLSTIVQVCWDGRDAQAHALVALSMKRTTVPHIHSTRTAKGTTKCRA